MECKDFAYYELPKDTIIEESQMIAHFSRSVQMAEDESIANDIEIDIPEDVVAIIGISVINNLKDNKRILYNGIIARCGFELIQGNKRRKLLHYPVRRDLTQLYDQNRKAIVSNIYEKLTDEPKRKLVAFITKNENYESECNWTITVSVIRKMTK